MKKNQNILLLGRTGNDKSTLANVLAGTDVFTEGTNTISETKNIKAVNFEINLSEEERIRYRVIDTPGAGDTELTTKEILFRLGKIVNFVEKDGINQIFFVMKDRFTNEEIEAYKLLGSIFDRDVYKYTTIVKTGFPEFRNEKVCEKDREKLRNREELKDNTRPD